MACIFSPGKLQFDQSITVIGKIIKFLVTIPHTSNYPDPISLKVGDVIEIGKQDDEFPGWIWVTTTGGNQGWAPIQYLRIDDSDKTAIAIQDYTARELNTTNGESLILHYELNGWGWVENQNKECGWVPMQTLKKMDA